MSTYEIYKHTAPNNMSYIGQTKNRKKRDKDHVSSKRVTPFTDAIKKFGWGSFRHETLATGLSKEEADIVEIEMISKFNTVYPNGFNLHKGGKVVRGEINAQYMIDMPVHKRYGRNNTGEKVASGRGRAKEILTEEQLAEITIAKKLERERIKQKRKEVMRIPEHLLKKRKKTQLTEGVLG